MLLPNWVQLNWGLVSAVHQLHNYRSPNGTDVARQSDLAWHCPTYIHSRPESPSRFSALILIRLQFLGPFPFLQFFSLAFELLVMTKKAVPPKFSSLLISGSLPTHISFCPRLFLAFLFPPQRSGCQKFKRKASGRLRSLRATYNWVLSQ